MLSSSYFRDRWSWYRPILNRGENPIIRCKVEMRRMPVRRRGDSGGEFIPYVMQDQVLATMQVALRNLQEYVGRYLFKGEKVSAHILPQTGETSRAMIRHLRTLYPHLPMHLLHHWCADERGGSALHKLWHELLEQAWRQDQVDKAPWVMAMNVLLLRTIRQCIAQLPVEEGSGDTNMPIVWIVGGLYQWTVLEFLRDHVDGTVEVTRIATYEAMIIPATPICFMQRQPDDSLLAEDRNVLLAYGLEPDLVPRMRELRAKLSNAKHEAGILGLLGQDRLGDHMLRRSWARLSIWELAEQSGQGAWMQWVLDSRKLDQLLSRPQAYAELLAKPLIPLRSHPFAAWFLAQIEGGRAAAKAGTPWQVDDRTLNAFRVLEEDLRIEMARRKTEAIWIDQKDAILGPKRGKDSDKLLEEAYDKGEVIYVRMDTTRSLHTGASIADKHAALRLDWSEWLISLAAMQGEKAQQFFDKGLLPEINKLLQQHPDIYLDGISATGIQLRGMTLPLLDIGVVLRRKLRIWYLEQAANEPVEEGAKRPQVEAPKIPACMALAGEWSLCQLEMGGYGMQRLASCAAVAQANAGVAHDGGVGRLIEQRDAQQRLKGLGDLRIEQLELSAELSIPLLYNRGFALTAPVLGDLQTGTRKKAQVEELHLERAQVQGQLAGYRLPTGKFDLISLVPVGREDDPPLMIVRIGKALLAGSEMELFELFDSDEPVAKTLRTALPNWRK